MSIIKKGQLVELHYDIFVEENGESHPIGGTREGDAFSFIPGVMETEPPGLGQNLLGKPVDFSGQIVLESKDAFGEALPPEQATAQVEISSFPEGFPLEKGMMFEAEVQNKGIILGTIVEIRDDLAIVFYGHPLAGKTIRFDVDVLNVQEASEDDVKRLMAQHQAGSKEEN